MADVMHSIASIFSRPTALWGFNALDNKDDAVPIKIEDGANEYQGVVMETGDDSDSEIEIVDFKNSNPTPQVNRASRPHPVPQANTTPRTNRIPQVNMAPQTNRASRPNMTSRANTDPRAHRTPPMDTITPTRQSENALRSSSNPQDSKTIERRERKRADHPTDLDLDENPKKKHRSSVNEKAKDIPAMPGGYAARTQSPPRPRQSKSYNIPSNPHKKPSLGGTLDFSRNFHDMSPGTTNSFLRRDHNTSRFKMPQSSTLTKPSVRHRGATPASRLNVPFDDDDSDEDSPQVPQSAAKLGAAKSVFTRMWSQPQSSVVATTAKHSAAADRARNRDDTSKPGLINYQPFRAKPATQKPMQTPDANADSKCSIPDTKKFGHGGATSMSATQTGRAGTIDPMPDCQLLSSNASMKRESLTGFGSSQTTDAQKDSKSKVVDPDKQQLRRQEGSRTKEGETVVRIDDSSAQFATLQTGCNMLESNLTQDSKPFTVESTYQKAIEAKPPPTQDDAYKRKKAGEAANARRQADLRREKEATRRAQEKAEAERLQMERQKSLATARRESEKRKQLAAEEEASTLVERTNALSKLNHVMKPDATSKATMQTDETRGSSLSSLLNTVSATPKTVQAILSPDTEQQKTESQGRESAFAAGGTERQASTARNERIRPMEARIEKMRLPEREREQREQTEESQPKEPNEPSLLTIPQFQPLPTGPVSLNSTAGARLLTQPKIEVRKNGMNNQTGTAVPNRSHERRLGEILVEDVELVVWRDKAMTFDDISRLFQRKGGQQRAARTLRRRYSQVKAAVKNAAISQQLQERLFSGCEDARHEVNRKLNGSPPPPSAARNIPTAAQHDDTGDLSGRSRHASHLSLKANDNKHSILSPASSFSSKTLSPPPTPPCSQVQDHGSGMPSTSGKTMNEEAFMYYLEMMQEDCEAHAAEKEARSCREPSPFTDDDYATFTYQVERRELCQDSIDEGFSIEDELWVKCSKDFDTVVDANIAAYKQLFRTPQGLTPGVDLTGNRQHKVTVDEGMELHELKGGDGGIRQVRVARFMQTYQKGLLPRNKDGWTPRTVFFIKQRTVTTAKSEQTDEMFGETVTETITKTIETDVDNEVYTTLDLANEMAIEKFVKIAFTPQSGHLTLRQIEIQQEEARLKKELDEDEEGIFHQHVEDDDGVQLDVWVEEGDLKGPRNLD